MPLSAAFCFFSPFHYKKKLLYQSFSLSSLPYLSSLFSFHSSITSLSTPISVILLSLLKITKNQAT